MHTIARERKKGISAHCTIVFESPRYRKILNISSVPFVEFHKTRIKQQQRGIRLDANLLRAIPTTFVVYPVSLCWFDGKKNKSKMIIRRGPP